MCGARSAPHFFVTDQNQCPLRVQNAKCGRHVSNVPILLQKSAAADQAFVPLERGDDADRWPIFLKDTKGLDITTGSGVSIQKA
jgi:hypothetical protein